MPDGGFSLIFFSKYGKLPLSVKAERQFNKMAKIRIKVENQERDLKADLVKLFLLGLIFDEQESIDFHYVADKINEIIKKWS